MKKYIYNIRQNFSDHIDEQNVWTVAKNQIEAEAEIRSEYHSIIGIDLIKIIDR